MSRAARHHWRLLPFVALYLSFGATLGFLGGAAPILLRARGVALGQVGLLHLIDLPLGLTFLWAAALDRVRLPPLPHRIGWVAAAQALGVALLLALSAGEGWPAPALFALAVGVSFAFATMDVALEALVVETVPGEARPPVTTAKLCGASLGGILGVGLLSVTYAQLGWRGSLLLLALVDALCLLPILRYPEDRLRRSGPPPDETGERGGAGAGRRSRVLLGRAALIGFTFAASGLLLTPTGLVLLDLHVSLAAVGFVTGTLGPAINLGAALASGALMARVSAGRIVSVMAVGVALSGALMVLATAGGSGRLGIAAAVLGAVAASSLGVPIFNTIYRWAQGAAAATDYSLLFGVGFLAAIPARVGGPALAGLLGWPAFFALATPLYVASLWLLGAAMRRTERADGREVA